MKVSEITTRFNAGNPCPVCGTGSKGCSVTADGFHFCRGEPAEPNAWIDVSKGEPDNAGFRHFRRAEELHQRPEPRAKFTTPTDWAGKAARFVAALTEALGNELAELLTLPLAALLVLRIGWDGGAWTFPECDGTGRTVGIARRFRDGKKKMLTGSNRGLTLPADWKDRTGAVFVVEGPTDTVTMAHAGLCCVGRPSNSGGADHLAELLADWPKERGIVVVGENDAKPSGDWPGRAGAESVGRALAAKLRRVVLVAMPPDGVKDVREWLTHSDHGETSWADRGAELRRHLEANAEPVHPSGPPQFAPSGPTRRRRKRTTGCSVVSFGRSRRTPRPTRWRCWFSSSSCSGVSSVVAPISSWKPPGTTRTSSPSWSGTPAVPARAPARIV